MAHGETLAAGKTPSSSVLKEASSSLLLPPSGTAQSDPPPPRKTGKRQLDGVQSCRQLPRKTEQPRSPPPPLLSPSVPLPSPSPVNSGTGGRQELAQSLPSAPPPYRSQGPAPPPGTSVLGDGPIPRKTMAPPVCTAPFPFLALFKTARENPPATPTNSRFYQLRLGNRRSIRLPSPIVDRWQTTTGPVAQNLWSRRLQACSLTADQFFRSVVKEGFHISWLHPPSLFATVKGKLMHLKKAKDFRDPVGPQFEAFQEEHNRMCAEEAVRRVRAQSDPPLAGEWDEHLCPIFAILQKDRFRAIFNMKLTNAQMKPLPFKMTGVAILRSIIRHGDWMASIDLKDAYLNIRIHHSQFKYQRYVFLGQVWEIVTLPFGNAQAPFAFTRFIKPLLKRWRHLLGVRCLAWLDDLVFLHQDPRHLAWALQEILDDLSHAGLKVNAKVGKSTLIPTQDLVWVGMRWCTKKEIIQVPSSKLHSVKQDIGKTIQMIRRGKTISAKEACRLIGKIQALSEALLPQRLFTRPILRDLRAALSHCKNYQAKVYFSGTSIKNLKWLFNNMFRWNGSRWTPPTTPLQVRIITDASPFAWGAILSVTGCKPIHTSGFFSLEEGSRWQNEREALGVMYAIKTFWTHLLHLAVSCSRLDPLRVLILQDNAAVVAYIRKMGGPKAAISRIVETFLREGLEEHIMFLAEWIAGSEMPADTWSRALALHDLADWELLPAVFQKICHKLDFCPTLDLFASRLNTKCPRYFSFRPDPYAEGWDALSGDKCWSEEKAYAAPPPHLIPQVLRKISQDRAQVLLFVPLWPLALWWRSLMDLASSPLLHIPLRDPRHPAVVVRRGADPKRWSGGMAVALLAGPDP